MQITLRPFSGSLAEKEFLFQTIVDTSIRYLMVPVTSADSVDKLPLREDYGRKNPRGGRRDDHSGLRKTMVVLVHFIESLKL